MTEKKKERRERKRAANNNYLFFFTFLRNVGLSLFYQFSFTLLFCVMLNKKRKETQKTLILPVSFFVVQLLTFLALTALFDDTW